MSYHFIHWARGPGTAGSLMLPGPGFLAGARVPLRLVAQPSALVRNHLVNVVARGAVKRSAPGLVPDGGVGGAANQQLS